MVFSSLVFICVFLPVTFIAYLLIPNMYLKNALLIVASLLFYAYGEPVYVFLMIVSTVLNWLSGVALGSAEQKYRKLIVVLSIIVNIGLLVIFKYADMLLGTINAIGGTNLPLPQIALPIGISFFTFQALSYVIDVYRGDVSSQRNYFYVLLYISFFPQLIAGPIVKYHDIADQIQTRTVTPQKIASGLRRFSVGLGKKVLIANTAAIAVDALFAQQTGDLNIIAAWTAALAYLVQIYFDFSGYSDMAIGLGKMFGFDFKENFNYPYKSRTIQEFWRRWHISLSTWFKQYVYFPLGGNRKGQMRTNINKLIVFFLCGLWHGASWTFVLWGLIHGLFMMLENIVPIKKLPKALGHIYTLLLVCLAFVLFRADTLGQAAAIITAMFCGWSFDAGSMMLALQQLNPLFITTMVIACVACLPVKQKMKDMLQGHETALRIAHSASYVASVLIVLLCMVSLSSGAYNPFIYFRF